MSGVILGEKSLQSQIITNSGERIPTTFVKTTVCYLIGVKSALKDKYTAIQIGFKSVKQVNKPQLGKINKAGVKTALRFLKEFRIEKYNDIKLIEGDKTGVIFGEKKIFIGDEIKPIDLFKKDELIDVSGKAKGKGFQGVVKRHHFKGGSRTHGQSDRERAPGSIGMTTTPGRVFKGKRMAGRMGNQRVTIKKLQIVDIKDNGLLLKGLVPGGKNGLLEIRSSI